MNYLNENYQLAMESMNDLASLLVSTTPTKQDRNNVMNSPERKPNLIED